MIILNQKRTSNLPKGKQKELTTLCAIHAIMAFSTFAMLAGLVQSIFEYNLVNSLIKYMLLTISLTTTSSIRGYLVGLNKDWLTVMRNDKGECFKLIWQVGLLPSCMSFFMALGFLEVIRQPITLGADVLGLGILPMLISLVLTGDSYYLGYVQSFSTDTKKNESDSF